MTAGPTIVCVGRLYCDLIFTGIPRLPTMGTEVFAGGLSLHAGGGAFITAAHLASLGHSTALSANLPIAPFRDSVVQEISNADVDTELCAEGDTGADPQVTVALAGQFDRAFITRRAGRAFPPLTATDLRTAGAHHIHIGELASLMERPELIALAREIGATLSLDCGWDDDLDVTHAGEIISKVDVFLPNEAELDLLTKRSATKPFAPLTVIKQGRNGASAINGTEHSHEPAHPVTVVDTTGAGDAFNAGFLSGFLSGEDIRACLNAGNAQGRLAVSQTGGFRPERNPGPLSISPRKTQSVR